MQKHLTKHLNSNAHKIFPVCPPFSSLTNMILRVIVDRVVDLEMKNCRQWVRSRLQERGYKPFEFVRTAPCYDPSQSNVDSTFAGNS